MGRSARPAHVVVALDFGSVAAFLAFRRTTVWSSSANAPAPADES